MSSSATASSIWLRTSRPCSGEIARVLRPGGRIGITDIVAEDRLTPDERAERGSYAGCIAGALSVSEFRQGLEAVGFADVSITPSHDVTDGMISAIVKAHQAGRRPTARRPVRPVASCRSPRRGAAAARAAAEPDDGGASLGRVHRPARPRGARRCGCLLGSRNRRQQGGACGDRAGHLACGPAGVEPGRPHPPHALEGHTAPRRRSGAARTTRSPQPRGRLRAWASSASSRSRPVSRCSSGPSNRS